MGAANVLALGYALAALAYAGFALLLWRGWHGRRYGVPFIVAAVTTALWAAVGFTGLALFPAVAAIGPGVEVLRNAAWLWLAVVTLNGLRGETASLAASRNPLVLAVLLIAIGGVCTAVAALAFPVAAASTLNLILVLATALIGLLILENLIQNLPTDRFWTYKHLLFAFGGLFTFELFRSSEALLLNQMTPATAVAQPYAAMLLIPFLAVASVRVPFFDLKLSVSRRFVFQTGALLVSGTYLLAVAALGFLARWLDVAWSTSLQVVIFFGAVLSLAALVASGAVRTRIRRYVERNFFRFAYDYRQQWMRFVEQMDADDSGRLTAQSRAIAAAAEPLDCRGGLLYLVGRDQGLHFAEAWNWQDAAAMPPPPLALIERLTAKSAALALSEAATGEHEEAASWCRTLGEAHLIMGLFSRGEAVGYIVLGKPFARQDLTWEDHDLLNILASQIGSYLALERYTRALAVAQQFERLSKNVSFVGHDLKNIVTQLSLILQQAEKHKTKPAFVSDAFETVQESVEKMQSMLLRLNDPHAQETIEDVDIAALVRDFVKRKRGACKTLLVEIDDDCDRGQADPTGLAAVLENLFANARDAAGCEGCIVIRLRGTNEGVELELEDDGPGMSPEFIRTSLFRPFASTKRSGYGLGMFQCRDMAERWGGRLDVESDQGAGTRVILRLQGTTIRTSDAA